MLRAAQTKKLRRLDAVDRDRRRRDRSRESWATERPAARIATRRYVGRVHRERIADNANDERVARRYFLVSVKDGSTLSFWSKILDIR